MNAFGSNGSPGSAGFNQEIDELLAQYRERRAQAVRLQSRIAEITGTATAQRRVVTVTVNAHGEITALEFPTGMYKRMAPKELADVIIATAQAARAQAVQRLSEEALPPLPGGVALADLFQGKVDLGSVLPAEPPMLDEVRAYIDSGGRLPRGLGR